MGPENSARLFQHMSDEEIEKITLEIASQKQVTQEQKAAVISEFYQMAMAKNYLSTGGLEYAQNVLEKALGAEKAASIINRLTTSLQIRPFDFLRKTDPAQLLNFIQNEHPQTIALIMAYLDPDQAATILSSLTPERQAETYVFLAADPLGQQVSGGYWDENNHQVHSNRLSHDQKLQEELWKVSEKMSGIEY